MNSKPTILYNGACPICRREIEHYRRLDRRDDGALGFADISEQGPMLTALDLSQDAAKRRLHVVDTDGRLLVGVPAFAAIWDRLPRYRWLASIVRLPGLRSLLALGYEGVAFCLYRMDKRRQRRQAAPGLASK